MPRVWGCRALGAPTVFRRGITARGLARARSRPRWERASFWNPTRWTPQSPHIQCRSKRRQIEAGEPPGAPRAAGAICPPAGGFSGQGAGVSPQPRAPETRGISPGIPENAGHGPRIRHCRLLGSGKIWEKEKALGEQGFNSADSGRRFHRFSVSHAGSMCTARPPFATTARKAAFFVWAQSRTY